MQKIALLLGLAIGLLLTNCTSDPAKTVVANAAAIPADIGGYWVNAAWWQELQSTKSPMKAAEKAGDIAAAIFHQDSSWWVADMSYNWHEGQQLTLREKDGGLQLYDPQNAAVQAVPLAPQTDGSIHLGTTPLVRLGDAFTGSNVIGSTLLGGTYDWKGKAVVFNPKGTVVGLEDYYRYELLLDYVTDQLGADQIMLSKEGKTPEFFAFKIDGNRLQLSPLVDMGGANDFQYKIGSLKYDLTKK